jgi:hypothetical protein
MGAPERTKTQTELTPLLTPELTPKKGGVAQKTMRDERDRPVILQDS